ncbi:MAG: hypothetical protein ACERKS_07950 [Candidatus Bathyarchaeota archaeon]
MIWPILMAVLKTPTVEPYPSSLPSSAMMAVMAGSNNELPKDTVVLDPHGGL